jgi:glycosyltransferase involved in cell wall biosynthesis
MVANSYAGLKANNLKRGFILYNGIDEKFLGPLTDRAAKRHELVNISNEKLVFISVANFVPYKDYLTVLIALKKLKSDRVDFHYLILGDGPLRKTIEDYIIDFGLEKNVTIIGVVEDVHEYLKISDIFIHSSKGEGCSNAILEAMAAGLPIVVTDTGGTPEIIESTYGELFQYKDIENLYSKLEKVLFDRDYRKMGENAKIAARKKYSVSTMVDNFYDIIEDILRKKRILNFF